MARMIGGIMPLELPDYGAYYEGDGVMALNCGRAAIYYALKQMKPRRLHLPLYLCEATREPAERLGIPYSYYSMDRHFLPVLPDVPPDEAVLWVNYYGVMREEIADLVCARYPQIIMDNTHAFFTPPRAGAYSVYSCRKFFGVADGGYLIADRIEIERPAPDTSYQKLLHRLKCIDLGPQAVYDEYVQNELTLAASYAGMSRLTARMMRAIDCQAVRARRQGNYRVLHKRLGHLIGFDASPDPEFPMVFAMLAPDQGFVSRLRARGVEAVNWWRHVLNQAPPGSFEHALADRLVQLPIDQRYGANDMGDVADIVLDAYSAQK